MNEETNLEVKFPIDLTPDPDDTLGVVLAKDRVRMEMDFYARQVENGHRRIVDARENLDQELKNQEILRGNSK